MERKKNSTTKIKYKNKLKEKKCKFRKDKKNTDKKNYHIIF
jgi:hypothetical protein